MRIATPTVGRPSPQTFFLFASLLVSALLLFGNALASGVDDEWGVYARGGWSTHHRGPANRKLVGSVELAKAYSTWTTLSGAAILTAPTVSPDEQTPYVTTGRAKGESNLHAMTLDGEPLWSAAAWTSPDDGVDPCAVLSSPIVDAKGDVYIGDCNQLFAFRPDGEIKWIAPLPNPREGDWHPSESLRVNAEAERSI